MIRINKDRSVYVPESDRHIGFENDNLVETRFFEILDSDLFGFSFKLDIKNNMNICDLVPYAETEESRIYSWEIKSADIGGGGTIQTQIRAFDASGERVWHSEWIEFASDSSINASKEADDESIITEFEQLEVRVQTAINTIEASAENARNDANSALLSAQNSAVSEENAFDSANVSESNAKQAENFAKAAQESAMQAKNIADNIQYPDIDTMLDASSQNAISNSAVSAEFAKVEQNIGMVDQALDRIIEIQENFI